MEIEKILEDNQLNMFNDIIESPESPEVIKQEEGPGQSPGLKDFIKKQCQESGVKMFYFDGKLLEIACKDRDLINKFKIDLHYQVYKKFGVQIQICNLLGYEADRVDKFKGYDLINCL